MKKTLLTLILAISTFAYAGENDNTKQFKVTIVNLTKGQPLTPAVVAVHAPQYQLFHLGQKASDGLSLLAVDGDTSLLVQELSQEMAVKRSATGKGIILPGQKEEILIEANDPRYQLSLVSMLARTNDAIATVKGISTYMKVGQKRAYLAHVYDAGAEKNTELCAHIPAPPCNSHGKGTDGGEGYIRPHEGFLGVGDLDANRDAFASVAAKIIVERVK